MPVTITSVSTWKPTPEVTQHNGRLLHPQMTFFAPPPPEIGSVLTAYSSVRKSKAFPRIQWHLTGEAFFMILSLIGLGGMFLGVGIFAILRQSFGETRSTFSLSLLLAEVLLLIPTKFIVDGCLEREYVCSYVGQQGIAEYRWSETSGLEEKILLFANFKSLRKFFQQVYVKPYVNKPWNFYSGTKYCLIWRDLQGRPSQSSFFPDNHTWNQFTYFPDNRTWWLNQNKQRASGGLISSQAIIGVFFSKAGHPRRNDPYYFAVAAERAWTSICLQAAQADLAQFGSVRFSIADGGRLEIQPGLLRVIHATGNYEYSGTEVRLGYEAGEVIIERANPKSPWKRSDTCVIEHSTIDNLEAFLTLVQTIVISED
jgi:hypothetical protein